MTVPPTEPMPVVHRPPELVDRSAPGNRAGSPTRPVMTTSASPRNASTIPSTPKYALAEQTLSPSEATVPGRSKRAQSADRTKLRTSSPVTAAILNPPRPSRRATPAVARAAPAGLAAPCLVMMRTRRSAQGRSTASRLGERDGVEQRVDVRELVPGDIVTLGIGNVVPADIRLLEATHFECDEAVLTGESMPAAKSAHAAPGDESDPVPSNCAFMGTIVHQGSARGVVVSTGSATAFGRIAVGLGAPPAYTAFQIGLNEFSRLLVWIAGILTVSIFVINVAMSRPVIDAVLFSLAIAIGITPQLLPAIVSVSLAAGSRGLARRKVLVKRLVTIEDLGNIRLLFTDKTGTLTEGIVTFAESLDVAGVASPGPLALGRVLQ